MLRFFFLLYYTSVQDKAAQDLAEAERKRTALELERRALRSEAEDAHALAQALARDKAALENSRNVLEDGSRELERRRAALEELQEIGRREMDAGKGELKVATEALEREKDGVKAARKVGESLKVIMV